MIFKTYFKIVNLSTPTNSQNLFKNRIFPKQCENNTLAINQFTTQQTTTLLNNSGDVPLYKLSLDRAILYRSTPRQN